MVLGSLPLRALKICGIFRLDSFVIVNEIRDMLVSRNRVGLPFDTIIVRWNPLLRNFNEDMTYLQTAVPEIRVQKLDGWSKEKLGISLKRDHE